MSEAAEVQMTGRMLQPLNLDEFAAIQLHELLYDEMASLKFELHEYRDNGDSRSWATVKLTIGGLHDVWLNLDMQLRNMGDPAPDTFERYMDQIVRLAETMPRSKANAVAYSAAVQKRRELRARVIAARKAHRGKAKEP